MPGTVDIGNHGDDTVTPVTLKGVDARLATMYFPGGIQTDLPWVRASLMAFWIAIVEWVVKVGSAP